MPRLSAPLSRTMQSKFDRISLNTFIYRYEQERDIFMNT
jgi:hypothetical protein